MAERAPYRTRQQMAILRHLQSTPGEHHTVASLKSFFDTQSVSIGTATIYRQMEKLIEEGLVRKYTLDAEESACYEYVGTSCSQAVPHFHCKCEKCGQLIHLSCDELSSIREHLLEHHGFLRQNNVFRHLSEMPGIVSVLKKAIPQLPRPGNMKPTQRIIGKEKQAMKQITRRHALALCICILFILFASSLSVIHDSDHHCAGEDCPVCAHIQMVLHLVRGLSLMIGLFLAALILFTQRLHRFFASALIPAAFPSTPVNLKVRLND